ncbi:MAG: NTP transferase domain-containing protein [Desulfobacteraceae bacterium]|jgi:UDP-N-acetylglucosamine diphosphorylase/glucosamine-1-phosphate N-acetyltransferase
MKNIAVIILAAGKGTRMKSDKAKVLHEINGKPMINYVVETASKIAGDNIVVVVGHQRQEVKNAVLLTANARFALQEEQKGTGHAVHCALPEIDSSIDDIVILCGDVPLISSETIKNLINKHENENAAVTVLAVTVENPKGYGRMIINKDGAVHKIVEEADANDSEKAICLINSGIYCVEKDFLFQSILKIKDSNAQNEFYLTDIVGIASLDHMRVSLFEGSSADEVIGVNTCDDLDKAQQLLVKSTSEIS